MLTKLSLFSGIGGDDLASEWAGIETVCFVEIDKFCQQVLKKHWPDIPIIGDVKDVTKEKVMAYASVWEDYGRGRTGVAFTTTGRQGSNTAAKSSRETVANAVQQRRGRRDNGNEGRSVGPLQTPGPSSGNQSARTAVDIISGGFPCQPHSVAGKRKGSSDERDLWPEFRRVIGEIRPRWVVAENVPGLFSTDAGRFFGEVCADLASLGYSVGWCTFGAVDVGAWHRRDRVFIVAHAPERIGQPSGAQSGEWNPEGCGQDVPFSFGQGLEGAEPEGSAQAERLSSQCGVIPDTQKPKRQQSGNTRPGRSRLADSNFMADTISPVRRWAAWSRWWLRQCKETKVYGGGGDWQRNGIWAVEPDVGRVAHGVPRRVDRLKALGNAVVPQQMYPIYEAIAEIECGHGEY